MARCVSTRREIEAAYIFGSVATGRARVDSDVDVAVLLGPQVRPSAMLSYRLQLMADLGAALHRSNVVATLQISRRLDDARLTNELREFNMQRLTLALVFVLFLTATASIAGQSPVYQSRGGPAYKVVTVVEGLVDPWSIAFLPGGNMLVTEKPGRLRVVQNGVLQADPIGGIPAVRYNQGGQGGLLEVTPHPDFANNRLLYFSYSKPNADGKQGTTAVARGRLEGNRLADVKEIFEAKAWSESGGHYGGRLAFDGKGYLFITVGDRQSNPAIPNQESHPAQVLSNHQGKIIRLHEDGRVPSDNPFVGRSDALPEIWCYGHRSPQGLIVHPQTGEVWMTEHGPQGGDELNLVLPGKNYGWPVIGYGKNYGGAQLHKSVYKDGMEQPIQFWTPVIAPSGLMLYTGDRFPQWKGSLFVGGLAGQQITRLPLTGDDGHQIGQMDNPHLLLGYGRIRDVRQGLDGFIYIAIDERYSGRTTKIVRLEPAGDTQERVAR